MAHVCRSQCLLIYLLLVFVIVLQECSGNVIPVGQTQQDNRILKEKNEVVRVSRRVRGDVDNLDVGVDVDVHGTTSEKDGILGIDPDSMFDQSEMRTILRNEEDEEEVSKEPVQGEFKNQTDEPLAVPSKKPLVSKEPGLVSILICFFFHSPYLGFPAEMAYHFSVLFAIQAQTQTEDWALRRIIGEKNFTIQICYESLIEKVGERRVFIDIGNYIKGEEVDSTLTQDLELLFQYNTTGFNFTLNRDGDKPVVEEGAIGSGFSSFQTTPQPDGSFESGDTTTKRIIASIAGLVFVIGITIIIIQLVPRDGAVGNDRPNVLRRRRFLRWVDNVEPENGNAEISGGNEGNEGNEVESGGVSTEVDENDLPSDVGEDVMTDDLGPTSSLALREGVTTDEIVPTSSLAPTSSAPPSSSVPPSSSIPPASSVLSMGTGDAERDLEVGRVTDP